MGYKIIWALLLIISLSMFFINRLLNSSMRQYGQKLIKDDFK